MKKIKMAFFAIATLTLLATSTGCSSTKVASAQASDTSSAKPEKETPTNASESSTEEKEAKKSTASNSVANKPLTVTGEIAGSEVFIKGRTVEIWATWCCDHEVTQGEYEKYCSYGSKYYPEDGRNYPTYYVSWYDALVYCNKRSIAEGLTPCYRIRGKINPRHWGSVPSSSNETWDAVTCDFTAEGYRLPTEAEWEYFARGGNTSNSGQTKYSGSDDIDAVAWYEYNSGDEVHEVKTKAPNALGLYDMSGNVRELCWDRSGDDERVARGGSYWNSSHCLGDMLCAVDYPEETLPYYRDYLYGFRVVRTVSNNDSESTAAIAGSEVFIKGRTVEIWAKWCCDHEVTQSEYQSIMGENPSKNSGSNHPVENVSWYDAIMYCNKKSVAAGRTPCYKVDGKTDTKQWGYTPHNGGDISGTITCDFTADGYRLPTEAEWEYFARGGNTSNSGQTEYSGSDDFTEVAWYFQNSRCRPQEVKTMAPNALGLYDMSGNVYEWCWDWYSDTITTSTPSIGAASGSSRVLRGGSFADPAICCIVSGQSGAKPFRRGGNSGFRVVCSRSE